VVTKNVVTKYVVTKYVVTKYVVTDKRGHKNLLAAIVLHCLRFGKIHTMEYNCIPKPHKIP